CCTCRSATPHRRPPPGVRFRRAFQPQGKRLRRTSVFLAIFLIPLGAILLLRTPTTAWKNVSVGPIILIALGLWLAFERGLSRRAWWGGGLIVPLILVALGGVLLLRDLDVLP